LPAPLAHDQAACAQACGDAAVSSNPFGNGQKGSCGLVRPAVEFEAWIHGSSAQARIRLTMVELTEGCLWPMSPARRRRRGCTGAMPAEPGPGVWAGRSGKRPVPSVADVRRASHVLTVPGGAWQALSTRLTGRRRCTPSRNGAAAGNGPVTRRFRSDTTIRNCTAAGNGPVTRGFRSDVSSPVMFCV
jgi:hypothetical protein